MTFVYFSCSRFNHWGQRQQQTFGRSLPGSWAMNQPFEGLLCPGLRKVCFFSQRISRYIFAGVATLAHPQNAYVLFIFRGRPATWESWGMQIGCQPAFLIWQPQFSNVFAAFPPDLTHFAGRIDKCTPGSQEERKASRQEFWRFPTSKQLFKTRVFQNQRLVEGCCCKALGRPCWTLQFSCCKDCRRERPPVSPDEGQGGWEEAHEVRATLFLTGSTREWPALCQCISSSVSNLDSRIPFNNLYPRKPGAGESDQGNCSCKAVELWEFAKVHTRRDGLAPPRMSKSSWSALPLEPQISIRSRQKPWVISLGVPSVKWQHIAMVSHVYMFKHVVCCTYTCTYQFQYVVDCSFLVASLDIVTEGCVARTKTQQICCGNVQVFMLSVYITFCLSFIPAGITHYLVKARSQT